MATIYTLAANVEWKVCRDRNTRAWIGVCDPLKITALGDTAEELHSAIFEAMDTLFRDLVSDGELDHFLYDRGWKFEGGTPDFSAQDFRFDIPIEVLMADNRTNACA